MKNRMSSMLGTLLVCGAGCGLFASVPSPKYIFLFIGDGMSTPQRMVAEEFSRQFGRGPLYMNTMPYQASARTRSASSLVTDSAAAATAIACGEKTNNGEVGMSVDMKPLVSVAEVARGQGRRVGIVTTTTICHATPAGFYAHRRSRSLSYQIGLDLVASGFDYFAGGGFGGKHNDTNDVEYAGDIYSLAEKAGYRVLKDRAALLALKPGDGKALYSACDGMMPLAIDGYPDTMATLAEMTAKGVEMLDNPNGFFMMVEGGRVDMAGHANDAATNLHEMLAMDDAVKVALDFLKAHPSDTLVIVTGDHETGGMSLGCVGTGYAFYMDRLARQKCSANAFADKFRELRDARAKSAKKDAAELSFDDVKPLLEKYFGFVIPAKAVEDTGDAEAGAKFARKDSRKSKIDPMTITKQERATLEAAIKRGARAFASAAKQIMNSKAGIGWTSGAHTGLPTLTTSVGVHADHFIGFIENTEISRRLKAICTGSAK